ncbi:hypothetical protein Vretimale_6537 [Volvox reticuliferus]|uniref:Uncharacterized protein n=1 Tax=Volvox reticuliferus TaxID=1737510 RepID=A0A8J4G7P0_9CHLO|nr:hypothetical protein Vretimale_6537 [Volvox reticuliferus]
MMSQSLAKLRSPAVLIAQNGKSLALPNYMADEVEESRASIVAALCSGSPLAGPSRTHSHANSAARPWEANGSRAGSFIINPAGACDESDDDVEDHASSPIQPVPLRSRRALMTPPSQQQYNREPTGISSPGELSSRRPTSANAPTPQSPRMHTPLASFSNSSPRRQATPTSDSSVFRRGSAGSGAAAVASGATAVGSHPRRPLSASATTQAQAPTGPTAAAVQQDLVAAVTGRMIQNFDYDDDSLDEEELAWDLAAAQDTLARALEMARSGVITSVTSADRSAAMARFPLVTAPVANGHIAAAKGMEEEINPAPTGEPGTTCSGGAAAAAAASAIAVAHRGPVGKVSGIGEGILDRFGQNCQLEAISGPGQGGTGCVGPEGGSGNSPWSPQPAAPSSPGRRSSPNVNSMASVSKGSNVLAAAVSGSMLTTATHGQTSYSSIPSASDGCGLPRRCALHIRGPDTDQSGDVEAGEVPLGSSDRGGRDGGSNGTTSPASASRRFGRFSIKDVVRRVPAAAGTPAAPVTQRGMSRSDEHSREGGIHRLKGLFLLAKKAFRRSIASPSPPSPSQLPISSPGECTTTSPVSAPRTPPANPGASPGLSSPGHSTPGAVAIASTGLTASTTGKGSAATELSGISAGGQLPYKEGAAASSQVNPAPSYARSSTSGTGELTSTTSVSPSPAPLPPPPSLQGLSGRQPNASATQVCAWSEGGGSGSSSSGSSSDDSTAHGILPLPGSYANTGGSGGVAAAPRRRSNTTAAGGGHVAVSELQVRAVTGQAW